MNVATIPFYKMCGSGNDFVFFDGREVDGSAVTGEDVVQALCAPHTGVGADGVVVLDVASGDADVRIAYYNSDGSRASLCGNATLCSARLATVLDLVDPAGFRIATDAGVIAARIRTDGLPEIDFQPLAELNGEAPMEPGRGERRIGFAVAGVPHLVVDVYSVDDIDLAARGRALRFDPRLPDGANVNFVAPAAGGGWRMRTYERGVEGETLACGTGAVATAAVLAEWGSAQGSETTIVTSSSKPLVVRLGGGTGPSLAGEGRLVYRGVLADLR